MEQSEPIALVAFNAESKSEYDCACPDVPYVLGAQGVTKTEYDCACADEPFRLSLAQLDAIGVSSHHPALHAPKMRLSPQLHTSALPCGYTLAFSPYAPAGPAVLNPQALARLQSFNHPQPLEQAVDYTLATQNLLIPAGQPPKMEWGKVSTLTAWLHVTNDCNLDCPYCYVNKSNEQMSDETGRRVIDAIFRSAEQSGFQEVKLKYAGGEAALHFDLVRRLHRYAQHLAGRKGLDLRAVILSNGTLWTPEMAAWLRENNVKLMVSLDGVGAAHDAMRPTRGGKGSFAQIERTVDRVLIPAGIRPDISITISGKNADAAADAVEWAIERDLPFSLNFYRENALSASNEALRLEETRIIEGMRRAYRRVEKLAPTRPFLNGLLDRAQIDAHTHTCGVGQNYLVFTHTGAVSQCQMHLANGSPTANGVDPLMLVKHGAIPQISVEDKEGCQDCVWRYRCTGGCPIETYRATGRFDVKSPHCNIYTTLFPEALRLEGLRLMKLEGLLG